MNPGSGSEEVLVLERSTWISDLKLNLSAEEIAPLLEPDREALFDAVHRLAVGMNGVARSEDIDAPENVIGSSAPLAIPRLRIHLNVVAMGKDLLERVSRNAILYFAIGLADPSGTIVGVAVDTALSFMKRLSQLSEDESKVVTALLEAKKTGGQWPSAAALAERVPSVSMVESTLAALERRGIVAKKDQGWEVV